MARILTEGFGAQNFLAYTTSGTPSFETSIVRLQGVSAKLDPAEEIGFVFSALTECYFRVAVYKTAGALAYMNFLSGGTNQVSIIYDAGDTFRAYRAGVTLLASSSTAHPAGRWYVVTGYVKVDDSAGRVVVKVDGTTVIDFTGDTRNGTPTNFDRMVLVESGTATNAYFDDWAINDTTGGADDSYPADAHIYSLRPDGDVSRVGILNQAASTSDLWQSIDEAAQDGDTTYVYSATSSDNALFSTSDLPTLPNGASIASVYAEAVVREVSADGDSVQLAVSEGGTTTWSSNLACGTSYAVVKGTRHVVNPRTSSAWASSDINNIDVGFKVV